MHNLRDPGLRNAVPDPLQAVERVRTRGQLVIEVWNPPPAAQPRTPTARAAEPVRRRAAEAHHAGPRLAAAAIVVAIHAAIAVGLWMTPFAVRRPRVEDPLVLLASLPAERPPLDLASQVPRPDLMPVALAAPRLTAYPKPAAEVAISISGSTDVMIREVSHEETEHIRLDCRRESAGLRPNARTSELTLLVRVERDGHVSDSRIESPSNSPGIDEAVRRCLLVRKLTPSIVNGAAVTSWQRLHWAPS
jgi:hypothetical protein